MINKIFRFLRLKFIRLRRSTEKTNFIKNILWNTWKSFSDFFMPVYPLLIFGSLLYFVGTTAQAGVIRRVTISTQNPTVIRVAKGRTTALQFWTKPEKLVLGSPNRVQVDFLGKDVTISPLAVNPGNLLIYTKAARYVVLFQLVSESIYDDVVVLSPAKSERQAVSLDHDTYHTGTFQAVLKSKENEKEVTFTAIAKNDEKQFETDQWPELLEFKRLNCRGCVIRLKSQSVYIDCINKVQIIECKPTKEQTLTLKWRVP